MKLFALALSIVLTGCATVRETYPSRTATEQLLISNAAEEAAIQIKIKIPVGRTCFLDTTNFEGVDAKYAVSAIRQKLLEQGIALMETRDLADTIIEIRAGALSIDSKGREITLPGLPVERILPIPTPLSFNKWSHKTDEGVAKISAFAYDKKSGKLISVAETVVGRSVKKSVNGETVVVRRP
jgi:hypothetical protein